MTDIDQPEASPLADLEDRLRWATAEIERLRALAEDALRGLHNDFEPNNQSALYNRIKAALEPKL